MSACPSICVIALCRSLLLPLFYSPLIFFYPISFYSRRGRCGVEITKGCTRNLLQLEKNTAKTHPPHAPTHALSRDRRPPTKGSRAGGPRGPRRAPKNIILLDNNPGFPKIANDARRSPNRKRSQKSQTGEKRLISSFDPPREFTRSEYEAHCQEIRGTGQKASKKAKKECPGGFESAWKSAAPILTSKQLADSAETPTGILSTTILSHLILAQVALRPKWYSIN